METIKNLLNQVSIINKKNNEILDATGGRFNIFRVCGVNHYENTHSAIIAEFLNLEGSHGLKSKLLECFIDTLTELEDARYKLENFNCENARIRTEQPTDDGRIDIFIEDNQGNIIIIENKIYAGDQPEQLKRYDKDLKKSGKAYQILYLTLFGTDASKESCEGVNYLPISYYNTIINWLEKCVSIAVRHPMVRETINQYINHLKQLTNQDMSTRNKEEITEILSDKVSETLLILENKDAFFQKVVDKYIRPKVDAFAKEKNLLVKTCICHEKDITIELKKEKWINYIIRFEFNNYRCGYGIFNIKFNTEHPDQNILFKLKQVSQYSNFDTSKWWYIYKEIKGYKLNNTIWGKDIINGNFVNLCISSFEELLKASEILSQ